MTSATNCLVFKAGEYEVPALTRPLIRNYFTAISLEQPRSTEQPRGMFWRSLAQKLGNWNRRRAARHALRAILRSLRQNLGNDDKANKVFREMLTKVIAKRRRTPYVREAYKRLHGVSEKDRWILLAAAGHRPGVWPSIMRGEGA